MSEFYWVSLKYMPSGVTANTREFSSTLTLYLFSPPILSLSIRSRRVLSPRTVHFRNNRPGTPELLWMLYSRDTPLVAVANKTSIYQLSSPQSTQYTVRSSSRAVQLPLVPDGVCSNYVELDASSCPVQWCRAMFQFWLHQGHTLAGYWLSSVMFFITFLSLVRYSVRIIMQQTFEQLKLNINLNYT